MDMGCFIEEEISEMLTYGLAERTYEGISHRLCKHSPFLSSSSAYSVFRRSPGHTQQFENPLLTSPFDELAIRHSFPSLTPHNIPKQASLIQPHTLLARQQSDAPVEDIITRKVDERCPHFVPRDEKQIDAAPNLGPRKRRAAMPFGSRVFVRTGERGFEEALGLELRDEGLDDGVTDVGYIGVWFSDNKIDVTGVLCASTVRAHYRDLEIVVDLLEGFPNNRAVLLDF
jgi:hypothetical protein